LAGPNGSGKSAVLEALALLTHCRFSNGGLPHGLSSLSRVVAEGLEARWSTSREPESRLFVSYLGTSPEGSDALLEGMDGPNRLFLLDEPEAGLHPEASARQVQWIYERVEQGCQFVIATHSMTLASLSRAGSFVPARRDLHRPSSPQLSRRGIGSRCSTLRLLAPAGLLRVQQGADAAGGSPRCGAQNGQVKH
jgi:hypothetical protein